LQVSLAPAYACNVRGQGGGPKTQRGKAASSRNAVKHGVTSDAPVIPGESLQEWQRFLTGIIASYEPVGQLETEHATTLASIMWRRRRVARFEVAAITANIQSTEENLQIAQAYKDRTLSKGILPDIPPEEVAEQQQRRILPLDPDLDKIIKYEAHFHRMQTQTQHELEALQSRRKGEHTPLNRIDFSAPPGP
jgi:hypothetical protein